MLWGQHLVPYPSPLGSDPTTREKKPTFLSKLSLFSYISLLKKYIFYSKYGYFSYFLCISPLYFLKIWSESTALTKNPKYCLCLDTFVDLDENCPKQKQYFGFFLSENKNLFLSHFCGIWYNLP